MNAQPYHTCPLCGGPNACAPASTGNLETVCWCREVTVSREQLARVPTAQRGNACLCVRCVVAPLRPGTIPQEVSESVKLLREGERPEQG